MKNTTFQDEKIVKLLNDKFWFISLDGEYKREILFNSRIFKYKPKGNSSGTHELVEQLAKIDGKISYPTLCVVNPNNEILFQFDESLNANELFVILQEVLKNR